MVSCYLLRSYLEVKRKMCFSERMDREQTQRPTGSFSPDKGWLLLNRNGDWISSGELKQEGREEIVHII